MVKFNSLAEWISNPDLFTRNVTAKDVYNMPVDPYGERAEKFCIMGAMCRLDIPLLTGVIYGKFLEWAIEHNYNSVVEVNDTGGYGAVKQMITECGELNE